jgi:hypothetical protein
MRLLRPFVLIACASVLGCGEPSDAFDCSGDGTARGGYEEINAGELRFEHAVVFPQGEGHTVLFSDDPVLAEVMRHSPDPESEGAMAAKMFGRLLVGFRFDAGGQLGEHLTRGTSTSWGTDGSDRGAMRIDAEGCARGDVRMSHNGAGYFAVPLSHPERLEAMAAVELGPASNAAVPAEVAEDDLLARYARAHARLMDGHPVNALEALGYSTGAASVLAADPRSDGVLARMRSQCVDPRTARVNEYGEIIGPSPQQDGLVFQGTVVTQSTSAGEVISNCYVMGRNGQNLEQCWPLETDCAKVPPYRPD